MSIKINNVNSESVTFTNVDEFGTLPQSTGDAELDKAIEIAGYDYDPKQDIFYSIMNPWQRNIGYCRLFDEASAPFGMIIDCEPIYFNYCGTKWMIGLWKGQYDLVSGGEIGVYTEGVDLKFLGIFNGTFYNCASNADLLPMSYTLKKNGQILFTRAEEHWWLTGFKLGEFSEPDELTMDINITLHNELMCAAFVGGLRSAGYNVSELTIEGNSVSFTFGIPHTPQPISRTTATDRIIQKKNKLLCDKYQEITGISNNVPDKIRAIKEQAPLIYKNITNIGKIKPVYQKFEKIFRSLSSAKEFLQ